MPLSAVIYAGNIFSLGSDLTSTSGGSVLASAEVSSYVSHGPLLPFKTVMDFYFCGKPIKLSEVVNATQNQTKLGCPETTGFLCSSGNNIFNYYSFKIFPCFWLVKTTHIIHHNQLLLTKCCTNDVKSAAHCKLLNWWHQNEVKSAARCRLLNRWPRKPGDKVVLYLVSGKTKSEMAKLL